MKVKDLLEILEELPEEADVDFMKMEDSFSSSLKFLDSEFDGEEITIYLED